MHGVRWKLAFKRDKLPNFHYGTFYKENLPKQIDTFDWLNCHHVTNSCSPWKLGGIFNTLSLWPYFALLFWLLDVWIIDTDTSRPTRVRSSRCSRSRDRVWHARALYEHDVSCSIHGHSRPDTLLKQITDKAISSFETRKSWTDVFHLLTTRMFMQIVITRILASSNLMLSINCVFPHFSRRSPSQDIFVMTTSMILWSDLGNLLSSAPFEATQKGKWSSNLMSRWLTHRQN
jgi:hypothetical protein